MKVTITYNKEKNGIELFFSGEFPENLATFLRELGFKESLGNKKKWYADNHPAYSNYAISLREVFAKEGDWKTIKVSPSFNASSENIDNSKFSLVTLHYQEDSKTEKVSFVVFDSYKKIATFIATEFGKQKFGENFKYVKVYPRNYKRKARSLLKNNHVITGTLLTGGSFKKKIVPSKQQEELDFKAPEEKTPSLREPKKSLKGVLMEVIDTFLDLENKTTGESETILGTSLFDLEEAHGKATLLEVGMMLDKAIVDFRNWSNDLNQEVKLSAITAINKLIVLREGQTIPSEGDVNEIGMMSVSKDINVRKKIIPNVLVPIHVKEPFQSGGLILGDANFLKLKFPELYRLKDEDLKEVSPQILFQLSQMAHPNDYGISVNRSALLTEWENRTSDAFMKLGYPIDLDYPYVNIHTGYRSVSRLGDSLFFSQDSEISKWWSVVEHSRPVANLTKGIAIIDAKLLELIDKRVDLINPRTKKPKSDKVSKEAYSEINWEISNYERSKLVIERYLDKLSSSEESSVKSKETDLDYIDKVIAIAHNSYAKAERLTKKKIEALKETTNAPNMGSLWEALELSWLLWYKQIYNEPISFESRLAKMDFFWKEVQPTYAYSDSSKEIYKQYSTPCPIGAIIAEYTRMKEASFIFEPSAGNGLLVVGADPKKTHVNEIDTSRKHSLKHQGFDKITNYNAAIPFVESMTKTYDVVVTNPPFAKWEADAFDKDRIVTKYFHKHRGLAHHIRLEHLMSGLALHTMKDQGKAAIVLMGHVYFGEDGLLAKYRPFFNWLYRHYNVDDIINMNSYKLYNKQGAVVKTMLILINGRKGATKGVAPSKKMSPELEDMVESFSDLWKRVKHHIRPNIETIIEQLKTAKTR